MSTGTVQANLTIQSPTYKNNKGVLALLRKYINPQGTEPVQVVWKESFTSPQSKREVKHSL